jgi:hypothetical protein
MPHPHYTSAAELAHPPGELTAEEGRRRYTTSKLCNLLFTYELDRRMQHGAQGVTVNAFDPGMMPGSGLARDYPPLQWFAWRYVLPALRFLPGVNSTRMPSRVMKRPSVGAVCSTAPNALAPGRLPTQSRRIAAALSRKWTKHDARVGNRLRHRIISSSARARYGQRHTGDASPL